MRVLLINPPFQRLKKVSSIYFPLSCGYLAGVLEQAGHEVRIYNAEVPARNEDIGHETYDNLLHGHQLWLDALRPEVGEGNHPVWSEFMQTLREFNPDMIGFTVKSPKWPSAIKAAEMWKRERPDTVVVMGGPHITVLPEEVMEYPAVDFCVREEGEYTLLDLVAALEGKGKPFAAIDGLSWRQADGAAVHNVARGKIPNLDVLPFPAKHLSLYLDRYDPAHLGVMVTLRGCPFYCGFCEQHKTWGRAVRFHSVDYTVREIKHIIQTFGTREISFWDDSFTVNRKRTIDLCQRLLAEKLNISWSCTTRVDLLDEEQVMWMKKSGCSGVDIGVETGSARMMKLIDKATTPERVVEASQLMTKYKLNWSAFFMMGFPEETEEDIEATKRFMQEIKPNHIIMSIFTPYPGTPQHEVAKRLNLLPAKIDWSRFSHQSPENHFVQNISRERFSEIVTDMMAFVDDINNGWQLKVQRVLNDWRFWARHPLLLTQKALHSIRGRGLGLGTIRPLG
ncbi:B12-binding domain-containing radical SAM protein [Candidatus Amarolinea aalborgensis]|jgi:radical SAM superfamily enzyme YgiQ (UPF0313 family)|uniref:B12-binding domain-containing radical SAM protein n=1 Tax=Candidatus Amarolinea aalborgensis TaxID=2249329 RepID=UPI003BF9E492